MKVKNNVHWVGKIDWELRKFHGDEYSTHRGSTYNSYLVREEKTALIDTVWEGTRVMAENIARGITGADPKVNVKLHNCAKRDKNDIVIDIFRSKALVLGSPTIGKGILTAVAALLEEVRGLRFKGKKAAAFGCYGWSGEAVELLEKALEGCGFAVAAEGLKLQWNPSEEGRQQCLAYERRLAKELA